MSLSIVEINNQITKCTYCRLHKTRLKAVCGKGKIPSEFMFIAQAPGRMEDNEGKILIGPSGKVFQNLLESVGLTRNNIYTTNLVKCFLPKCRKPRQDEIDTCYELYLKSEIDLVKPEIIVALGYHVTKFIFKIFDLNVPNKFGFKTTFGKLFVSKNRKIIPLRHPATVVHNSSTIEKLHAEYSILKTLQFNCKQINKCETFNQYRKGLLPSDFVNQFCFGNWKCCSHIY